MSDEDRNLKQMEPSVAKKNTTEIGGGKVGCRQILEKGKDSDQTEQTPVGGGKEFQIKGEREQRKGPSWPVRPGRLTKKRKRPIGKHRPS